MKTLVAVDGSRYTRKMVDYLVVHTELLDPKTAITVNTVLPEPPIIRVYGNRDREQITRFNEQEAQRILEPAVTGLSAVYKDIEAVWRSGPEGLTIAVYAINGGFDLIVMGARGRSTVGKLLMGSTATKVLEHCELPMLLVR